VGDLTVHMARDGSGIITSIEPSIVELLGWLPEQMVGSPSTRFIHPEDQGLAVATWMAMITSPGTPHVWRGRYQDVHGAWIWVETSNVLEDPEKSSVSTSMRRATNEQAGVEEERRAREQFLSRLSDALPVGVFQFDATGRVTFTNDRLHKIVGMVPAATIDAQLSTVVAEDRPVLVAALAAVLADQPVDDVEIRLHPGPAEAAQPGGERACLLSLRPLTDSNGVVSGAVGCLSDETDRAQLRRQLEVKATVDELTSCLNRAATLELLRAVAAALDPAGTGNALVFLDLDEFKSVNDRFGHAAGDLLLVAAADRIRSAVRDRDRVGRVGGDEFLVICPRVQTADQAVMIAERISAAITTTVDVGPDVVELRASIGVAWTDRAFDPDTLVALADEAMYESKRAGQTGVTMLDATRGPS
jgi:diguanylate cyclase (GGDEF)-like protein/PAS domain S-box-containing protein